MVETRANYGGTIPEYYDRCLGPAWFDAFGADLARRLPDPLAGDVLEIACGTGLVTRRLRARIDAARRLVASDISQAMLDYARNKLIDCKGIEWREADAASLPFDAGEFSAVVCAFGMMFVPDKRAVFREVRRVLKSGGTFLFNVWDRIEDNPAAVINAEVVEGLFPGTRRCGSERRTRCTIRGRYGSCSMRRGSGKSESRGGGSRLTGSAPGGSRWDRSGEARVRYC